MTEIRPNTPEWLSSRSRYFTASDAGVPLGLCAGKSPASLCLAKWGMSTPPTPEQEARFARGHELEALVARLYCARTGVTLTPSRFVIHPTEPWLAATPDRFIRPDHLLEIKTANQWASGWRDDDTGPRGIPGSVHAQAIVQMACTGANKTTVAALRASEEVFDLVRTLSYDALGEGARRFLQAHLCLYEIPRDRALEAVVIEAARKLWFDHILPGQEDPSARQRLLPEPDGHAQTDAAIGALLPTENGTVREATNEEIELCRTRAHAKARAKEAQEELSAIEQRIRILIGDDRGFTAEGVKATWANVKGRSEVDWPAIARDLAGGEVPQRIVEANTGIRPGYRRLLITVKEAEGQEE